LCDNVRNRKKRLAMNYKFIIALFIAFALGYLSRCEKVHHSVQDNVIKRKIVERKEEAKTIEAKTAKVRAKLQPLKRINSDLVSTISIAKDRRDTVTIIVAQDSLIEVQRLQIKTLESALFMQDMHILTLKEVIDLQDMSIEGLNNDLTEKNKDLKKHKRNKNFAIVGWIATTIGLIVIMK